MSQLGIIICSRLRSSRFPRKVFEPINGKPVIYYLLDRLRKSINCPIIVAVPEKEKREYEMMLDKYDIDDVMVFGGDQNNVLKRMVDAAAEHGIDDIVRITHDKIFVDTGLITYFYENMKQLALDYIYSTNFIQGTGFEIFTYRTAAAALEKMDGVKVEHITYALDLVAPRKYNIKSFYNDRSILRWRFPNSRINLLIDYPEDIEIIRLIIESFGHHVGIDDIISRFGGSDFGRGIDVSIYTCFFNDVTEIKPNILSVSCQTKKNWEHIIYDDGSTVYSTGNPLNLIEEFAIKEHLYEWMDKRVLVSCPENCGLASASNFCISQSRGRYVMRLDVDDYLVDDKALSDMVDYMDRTGCDILYPSHYQNNRVFHGSEGHHAGGAMMRRKTLDYIRFTDGLKHFDGLDFYERAIKMRLDIHYYNMPTFHYRERPGSLSRTPSPARKSILDKIKDGILGDRLLETGVPQ